MFLEVFKNFNRISCAFQGRSSGLSREFQGSLAVFKDLRGFQGRLRVLWRRLWRFYECFRTIFRSISGSFR